LFHSWVFNSNVGFYALRHAAAWLRAGCSLLKEEKEVVPYYYAPYDYHCGFAAPSAEAPEPVKTSAAPLTDLAKLLSLKFRGKTLSALSASAKVG
jgi:hypothetical protein